MVAPAVPDTSPERAEQQPGRRAHSTPITAMTRVRRRPSMRCSTTSWSSTITRVLAANAKPRPRVEISPTARAYAGMPAFSWE